MVKPDLFLPAARAAVLLAIALAAQDFAVGAEFDRRGQPPLMDEHGFAATSDEFSIVAVPQEDHLKLLVERFGEARAITKANIEIHAANKQASVTEVGDGVYRASDAWLLEPGKKALAVTIRADDMRDVLVIVFDPAQGGGEANRRAPKYGPRQEQPEQ